jgi:hypothetical protein
LWLEIVLEKVALARVLVPGGKLQEEFLLDEDLPAAADIQELWPELSQ